MLSWAQEIITVRNNSKQAHNKQAIIECKNKFFVYIFLIIDIFGF